MCHVQWGHWTNARLYVTYLEFMDVGAASMTCGHVEPSVKTRYTTQRCIGSPNTFSAFRLKLPVYTDWTVEKHLLWLIVIPTSFRTWGGRSEQLALIEWGVRKSQTCFSQVYNITINYWSVLECAYMYSPNWFSCFNEAHKFKTLLYVMPFHLANSVSTERLFHRMCHHTDRVVLSFVAQCKGESANNGGCVCNFNE